MNRHHTDTDIEKTPFFGTKNGQTENILINPTKCLIKFIDFIPLPHLTLSGEDVIKQPLVRWTAQTDSV